MDQDEVKKEPVGEPTESNVSGESLQTPEVRQEAGEAPKPSQPHDEKELRQKIEAMQLDPGLSQQSKTHASDIQSLPEKEKLDHLLTLTKKKGIVYAIHVAKNMKDPYVLDALHDMLAKGGYYKDFKL